MRHMSTSKYTERDSEQAPCCKSQAHITRQKNKDIELIKGRMNKTKDRLADVTAAHEARGKQINDLDRKSRS